MEENVIISQAHSLLTDLLASRDKKYNFGTVVNSIYDTAWISMVSKKSSAHDWAFPECFQFLCREQAEDGGWGNPISLVERISCTFVSLLAIKTHLRPSGISQEERVKLQRRADNAVDFIRASLPSWDIDSLDTTLPMAMELWFPVVVERLEAEDVVFDIPGLDHLMQMREEKLSRFPVDTLYQRQGLIQPSPLFTLEGFIGRVDFDRLRHQKVMGSMFTSPASTAVYLMECSEWDIEAEEYLQHVVEGSIIKNNRSVPTIFPTSTFDIDWIFSIFLDGGLNLDTLKSDVVSPLMDMILKCLDDQDGIIGAERLLCPEPDSTAMALRVLDAVGIRRSVKPMIDCFEGSLNYFTYKGERDPSISTNAHVLQALVLYSTSGEYTLSVEKCIRYICKTWWNSRSFIQDKWAFIDFLSALGEKRVDDLSDSLLKAQLPLVLIQAIARTLLAQNTDGSWGSGSFRENTAYAIMILKSTWRMPFETCDLKQFCDQAIRKGQAFIYANMETPFSDYNWNGKCVYGLLSISRAAALSALLDTRPSIQYPEHIRSQYNLDAHQRIQIKGSFLDCRILPRTPPWLVETAAIEGHFLLRSNPHLRSLGIEPLELAQARLVMVYCCATYLKGVCLSNEMMSTAIESVLTSHADRLVILEGENRPLDTAELIETFLLSVPSAV
ncbi:hypothetical protein N7528_008249 [Penicillium herquei]|nr:hypothetical protein N7528_008249 [Penicillium herquei]